MSNIPIEVLTPKKRSDSIIEPLHTKNYIGGTNHGNTCYLNSLIQTLFMTPKFRQNILKFEYSDTSYCEKNDCIPYQLQKLFARGYMKLRLTEETTSLTRSFQWSNSEISEQNDIQELCHILFDTLDQTIINDSFQGELVYTFECDVCHYKSERTETFIDGSLPVKSHLSSINSGESSFKKIFEIEEMTDDNKYFCEKCNQKNKAYHYCKITHLPPVLMLALNRFEYDYISNTKKKINSTLTFPTSFSTEIINGMTEKAVTYSGFSVIVHSGSARGGHYYTISKSFEDCKWYKFDDSSVYEINEDDGTKGYGDDNDTTGASSSNAYIGLYTCDKDHYVFTKENINKELMEEITKEEEEYNKLIEEEKERLSYINGKFSWNGKYEYLKIKKQSTMNELKARVREMGKIENCITDIRIKVMSTNGNKLLDIIGEDGVCDNNSRTIEEGNSIITSNKIYAVDIRSAGDQFEQFNPNEIIINVLLWNDKLLNLTAEKDFLFQKMKIDRYIKYSDFISRVNKEFLSDRPESDSIKIFKKQEYGINNFNFIHFTESEKDFFNTEDIKIFIEPGETQISTDKSKFQTLLESFISNVTIYFNTPIEVKPKLRITVKSYKFNLSIDINPKKTIEEMKDKIAEKLGISPNMFLMKKNTHNGVEIKKLSDTIDKYTSKSGNVYIQFGTPINESTFKINLQFYSLDLSSTFMLFPYKITEGGNLLIDNKNTIDHIISLIQNNGTIMQKITQAQGKTLVNPIDTKLYIRRENNFKPGKIYNGNEIIDTIKDIKENTTLICQYLNKSDLLYFNPHGTPYSELFNFAFRLFNQNSWTVTAPVELLCGKGNTIEDLVNLISEYFKKENIKISLQDLYGVKAYNKEMYYYMDDINKMEFYSFSDFSASGIENFPLMLNNEGCLLFIKDMSYEFREPNEEEQKFYFKSNCNVVIKTNGKGNKKESSKKVYQPVKQEKYKEKAMVIKVKTNEFRKSDNNNING